MIRSQGGLFGEALASADMARCSGHYTADHSMQPRPSPRHLWSGGRRWPARSAGSPSRPPHGTRSQPPSPRQRAHPRPPHAPAPPSPAPPPRRRRRCRPSRCPSLRMTAHAPVVRHHLPDGAAAYFSELMQGICANPSAYAGSCSGKHVDVGSFGHVDCLKNASGRRPPCRASRLC